MWRVEGVIGERLSVPASKVAKVLDLLKDGNTVPFIARYRRDAVGDLTPEAIRNIAEQQEALSNVKTKCEKWTKDLEAAGKLTLQIKSQMEAAQTMLDLEDIYSAVKPSSGAQSLAGKAREQGLEEAMIKLLDNKPVDFKAFVKSAKGVSSVDEAIAGTKHLLAEHIANDTNTRQLVRTTFQSKGRVTSTLSKRKQGADSATADKYKTYADFSCSVSSIKPHQVLAINRGEEAKVLSVGVALHDGDKRWTIARITDIWRKTSPSSWQGLLSDCVQDAFDRLLCPRQVREVRRTLTEEAEKGGVRVFASNLKALLLTQPVPWQPILGIDPGFKNGCKVAVISACGDPLYTSAIFPHPPQSRWGEAVATLVSLLDKHGCTIAAIGNGHGCRETERLLVEVRQQRPALSFTIVDESGASVDSVTARAEADLPGMDPMQRSAVALARRVQDPLSELIKVEPRHLGVGMYQHDIPEKLLDRSLSDVVQDCVALVGANINTCGEALLSHIPGLTQARARAILEHRKTEGPFRARKDIRKVRGIGEKTFEQCAGFLRIVPNEEDAETILRLEASRIHPESYGNCKELMGLLGAKWSHIGGKKMGGKIERLLEHQSKEEICAKIGMGHMELDLILEELQRDISFDPRQAFSKPLFLKDLVSLGQLKVGQLLRGRVNSVTDFGAFVDCGVGTNGLVHVSQMVGSVQPGQVLDVRVVSVEMDRKRLGLSMHGVVATAAEPVGAAAEAEVPKAKKTKRAEADRDDEADEGEPARKKAAKSKENDSKGKRAAKKEVIAVD